MATQAATEVPIAETRAAASAVPLAPAAPVAPVVTTTTVSTPAPRQTFMNKMDTGAFLVIRRVVWIALAGIPLGLLFLLAALPFALTIIGWPIAWELLKIARFAFCPVGYKAIPASGRGKNPLRNPRSPLTIALNILWAITFGIPISVVLLFMCIIQALTIIGIPSALQFPKLALLALWPFGKKIVNKQKYKANKQARRDLATAEAVRRNEAAALAATTPMERV